MDKEFLQKLNNFKRMVLLNEEKKQAIRRDLVSFFKAEEIVRMSRDSRLINQRSFFTNLFVSYKKYMSVLLIIAITTLVGGGVSAAAENALPGDVLYVVKINVNEEVRAAIALSMEAKTEWEARRAERRLEEAERMAAKDGKSVEVYTDLEARFEEHAEKVKDRLADLEANGKVNAAVDLASKFENSLKAHEGVLAKVESKIGSRVKKQARVGLDLEVKTDDVAGVSVVSNTVNVKVKSMMDIRAKLESKVAANIGTNGVQSAAEGKIGAADNFIVSTRNYLENRKTKLGVESTTEAEAKLESAEDIQAQAKTKLQAKVYAEAFRLATQAMRIAQEARALVDVNLHADVFLKVEGITGERISDEKSEANTEVRSEVKTEVNKGIKTEGTINVKVGL